MQRVSIAAMMGLVSVAAVGLAALTSPSAFWAGALYSLTLVALGVGLLGAILTRRPHRAFWIGFALFGCGYLYLAFEEPPGASQGRVFRAWASSDSGAPRPPLVTTSLLEHLRLRAARGRLPAVGAKVQVQWGSAGSYYPATITQLDEDRVQILWQGYVPGQEEWAAATRVQSLESEHVLPAGHSLFALILALFGGLLARGLFGRREGAGAREEARAPSPGTRTMSF